MSPFPTARKLCLALLMVAVMQLPHSLGAMQPGARSSAVIVDAGPARWRRASDNMAAPSRLSAEAGEHGPAIHLAVRSLRGWDNFSRAFDGSPFPAGNSLTCFWVRSERAKDTLAVEWQERDGSRWIAAVPVDPTWQRIVLTPGDFAYWPDSPTGERRGAAGDRFRPSQAARLTL